MGWSSKYKKSIDCNNPKGFSQKAHCQGRKKKNENNMKLSEFKEVVREISRNKFYESLNEGRIPKLFLKIEAVKKEIKKLQDERKSKFGGEYAKKVNAENDQKKRIALMKPILDITKKITDLQKNLVKMMDMEDRYISQMGMDQELDSSIFERPLESVNEGKLK